MTVTDLTASEYPSFYAGYVGLVPPTISLRSAFDDSAAGLTEYLNEIAEDRENYAYAPGKWTIKECLQHLIDTERVFSYRALRLGRHDATPLPGFEQDDYAAQADVSGRDFKRMIAEFELVRKSTMALFSGLGADDLSFRGTVNGGPMSCRAIGFITCGHTYHHLNLYRDRY
ncbi:DinB family protein [Neolewinella litorea]|uniref:DinB family protein n=1 Tax=Neolewinella litorea TaxID=2562452 RepID=A0A4V3XLI8_9BACT|nr:DinB family protein [Neolewinella litorea]THH41043.1 DinB family protein [Neolewinella litorea]